MTNSQNPPLGEEKEEMKKEKTSKKPISPVRVWTWKIKNEVGSNNHWMLCKFTALTKSDLVADGKPSPEAVPVRVRLVPDAGWTVIRNHTL